MAGGFYTPDSSQLLYDSAHFERKLHALSNTAFYRSIVSKDKNMVPSTGLSRAQVLTFG